MEEETDGRQKTTSLSRDVIRLRKRLTPHSALSPRRQCRNCHIEIDTHGIHEDTVSEGRAFRRANSPSAIPPLLAGITA